VFIAARFFVGFGTSLSQNAAPLLLTEICHPQHRARVTAIYNTFYNVGSIAATWITFGTFSIKNEWSWRIPSLVQALPSLVQFCLIWLVPESPRWLISQDRNEEALEILAKYHANGNCNDPAVIFEYAEIRETIHREQIAGKTSRYVDFIKTKGNRYRLFLLVTAGFFSQWSGNGLTSYYFGEIMISIGVTDRKTQFEVSSIQSSLSIGCFQGRTLTERYRSMAAKLF
jgi:MFS family permease